MGKYQSFKDFLHKANFGESFTYAVGYTVFDGVTQKRTPEAEEAWAAYENGEVALTQRRVPKSDGVYEYIAQKL